MDTTFLVRVVGRKGIALAFALAAQCFIAGSAGAQISGTVTRAGGLPLEGVSVEAWSVDRRVGATTTDAQGVFSFSETIARSTVLLRVGALGFEVGEVAVRRNSLAPTMSPQRTTGLPTRVNGPAGLLRRLTVT